jgi:hypothetical protein
LVDTVISSMTLHHIEDVPRLLHSFWNSLSPGGWLGIADLEEEGGDFHGDPQAAKHHGFNPGTLATLVGKIGFQGIKFTRAYTMFKKLPEGDKAFPIFLLTAQKPLF